MIGLQLLFFTTVLFRSSFIVHCSSMNYEPSTTNSRPFDFFAVSDLERVFEDGYNCPGPQDAIEIFGIRNEYVCAQCVIKACKDLGGVNIYVDPLRHAESSAALPEDAIKWNFVGSISIEQNTPKYRKADLIRPAPAWFPD